MIDLQVSLAQRVEALLEQMTLAEKVGQMTQVEKNSIAKEDITRYSIGSLLSGGGGYPTPNTAEGWLEMVNDFQEYALKSRLGIPLIYGVDAVHGHNNLYGATIFPHNIGLGAAGEADLIERIGRATGLEVAATGIRWNFAPAVSIPRDMRWGRTYEGYSEDPNAVSEMGAAYVRGSQASLTDGVLASVKHYVGDGGTSWGSTQQYAWIDNGMWVDSEQKRWQIDQGTTEIDEEALRTIHLPPYAAAIAAGARNIMVSYSSWGGLKMHQHHYLLTEVLKGELGFEGFLVSDWMAIDQIEENFYNCVVQSINAGLDMIMVPYDYKRFIETLTRAVETGDVSEARLDDAVRRILTVKLEFGLFENPLTDATHLGHVGSAAHRALAREAVQKSQVLLKNTANCLPLAKETPSILVAGAAADDIGLQCGGWTIEWMGKTGAITAGTTILEGIRALATGQVTYSATGETDEAAAVGLVILSEPPYAEGEGDNKELQLSPEDIALVERVRPHCEQLVVILLSGRPLIITPHLDQWDAFIAGWLPGSEGQGVADVLFGDAPFTGRLPHAWPRDMTQVPRGHGPATPTPLWPLGAGLTTN